MKMLEKRTCGAVCWLGHVHPQEQFLTSHQLALVRIKTPVRSQLLVYYGTQRHRNLIHIITTSNPFILLVGYQLDCSNAVWVNRFAQELTKKWMTGRFPK
jgi:hypothetical protein